MSNQTKGRLTYGRLSVDNVDQVAEQIRELLAGKTFAVASADYADSGDASVALKTDATLSADWTAECIQKGQSPDDPLLVSKTDGRASVSFSAAHYFWTFTSDDVFVFEHDSVRFEALAPAGKGCLHKHLFKIQQ